jgi:hypothetical protein
MKRGGTRKNNDGKDYRFSISSTDKPVTFAMVRTAMPASLALVAISIAALCSPFF